MPIDCEDIEKHCQRCLENWREIIVCMNSLLLWNKPFYPGIIVAVISVVFMLIWYMELSVLTTLSVFGIIVCFADFAVPVLSNVIFDSSQWSGPQQRKFEETCHSFVQIKNDIKRAWECWNKFKSTQPKLYFVAVAGSLIVLIWIGNLFSNMLLSYVIVLMAALFPGFKNCPLFEQQIVQGLLFVKDFISKKIKQN